MANGGSSSSGQAEKIVKPGYHIRSKHDLHGLRQRRRESSKGHLAGELPLTAMIDMFSILVIYLLMNFSATGDPFFMGKPGVLLPTASNAKEMQTAPLLSFVKGTYYLDALTPNGGQLKIEDDSQNLLTIIQSLQKLQLQIKQKTPREFNGRLNIQADENTPLLYIKRAMSAGTSAGWTSINFVVIPDTSK
jgi:biopolymer transport protein ExbD